MWTLCVDRRCCACGTEADIDRTVGAPHKCVTPCSLIIGKIEAVSIARRQICVPALATVLQAKAQALQ